MRFIAIILAAGAVLVHGYLLLGIFAKDPNLFFRASPFHRFLLRMDSRLYTGLTFVVAFLAAVVVGELGRAGLGLAIVLAVAAYGSLRGLKNA